jgi:hypothetical protein
MLASQLSLCGDGSGFVGRRVSGSAFVRALVRYAAGQGTA